MTVDRVDFLGRQVAVDRQLDGRAKDRLPLFGPPKSKRSYRTLPLADVTIEGIARDIEDHRVGNDGLVLARPDGRPLLGSPFGATWRKLRSVAKLPTARYHDTRHTFASVLLSGGRSVAGAADYLGHSPAVLLNTYPHLMPADHDRAGSVVSGSARVHRFRNRGCQAPSVIDSTLMRVASAAKATPNGIHIAAIFQSVAYLLGAGGLIFAVLQLRETRRNGTVAAAALFTERWDSPRMREARAEANKHHSDELSPLYEQGRDEQTPEFALFQEELNFFEDLGTLVKLGAVDPRWIRLSLRLTVLDRWDLWEPTVRFAQLVRGRTTYANFEFLRDALEKD